MNINRGNSSHDLIEKNILELMRKVRLMKNKTKLVKQLRDIEKELKISYIYYNTNLMQQSNLMDKKCIPEEIQKVVFDSMKVRYHLAETIKRNLEELVNECYANDGE